MAYVNEKNDNEKFNVTLRVPDALDWWMDRLGSAKWGKLYRKKGSGKRSTQYLAGVVLFLCTTPELRQAALDVVSKLEEEVDPDARELTRLLQDAGLPVPQEGTAEAEKKATEGLAGILRKEPQRQAGPRAKKMGA